MRTAAPPLLPIFRSALQGALLALVLPAQDRAWTAKDLAQRLGAPYQTTLSEVRRLEQANLLRSEAHGRTKLISANRTSPYYEPLERLATMSFGPPFVIADEFAAVSGIEELSLYGSWAARYEGGHGPPPRDVDVLVIGQPDRDAIFDATERSRRRLGIEVDVVSRSAEAWRDGEDGFTRAVKAAPRLLLSGPWTPGT